MNNPHGRIRIIGGRWRGTRLDVPSAPGLRPTSDRVRETLFNWLMPALPGARVLDIFAGTGALGFEALSRGAREAVLLERDPAVAATLAATLGRLPDSQGGRVVRGDALAWLASYSGDPFDIAFVDPPFGASMWRDVWPALAPHLAADALVHVESPHEANPAVPGGWSLHREGRTREVCHALYRVPAGRAPAATLAPDRAAGEPPTAQ